MVNLNSQSSQNVTVVTIDKTRVEVIAPSTVSVHVRITSERDATVWAKDIRAALANVRR